MSVVFFFFFVGGTSGSSLSASLCDRERVVKDRGSKWTDRTKNLRLDHGNRCTSQTVRRKLRKGMPFEKGEWGEK